MIHKEYALIFLSLFVLVSCDQSSNDKNNRTKGTLSMTRTKTASGLSYETMQTGSGATPQRKQRVMVHYTGWLDDNGKPGMQFDSSVDRGKPFSFVIGVGQVIQGWDEGVMSMKVGEKRRLFIPAVLGYGAHGVGSIPPHANLIFDVELLSIG